MESDNERPRGIELVFPHSAGSRMPLKLADWRSRSLMQPGFEERIISSVRHPLRLTGPEEDKWRIELLLLGWDGLTENLHGMLAIEAVRAAAQSLAKAEKAVLQLRSVSPAFELSEPDVRLTTLMQMHREGLEAYLEARPNKSGRHPAAGWSSWAARALALFEEGFLLPVGDPQASRVIAPESGAATPSARFLQALLAELRSVRRPASTAAVPDDASITAWIRGYRRNRRPQKDA